MHIKLFSRSELAHPVMGTIFLVAPMILVHLKGVQNTIEAPVASRCLKSGTEGIKRNHVSAHISWIRHYLMVHIRVLIG